jgi:hypothetical protein
MPNSKKSQPTTSELIKAEIERMHRRGGIDGQNLVQKKLDEHRPIIYNAAQAAAAFFSPRFSDIYNEWGRGTGKSYFLAHRIRELVYAMPRGVASYIAPTYQKMLTEMLPSTFLGLERQGFHKDLHYFVGRRPPKSWNWPLPYQPPERFDHFISFWNGFGIHLISQDVTGSGRGLNLDAELSDESALLDKSKMDATTSPALRGSNKKAFKDCHLFGSRLHMSSTPLTPKGKWFIGMEIEQFQNPKVKFIKADSTANIENLRDGFLEEARRTTHPTIYQAEYMNIRPRQILDGFYPLLDEEKHGYNAFDYSYYSEIGKAIDCRGDADLNRKGPMVLGVDWGFNINAMVACQHTGRELRALKSFFALGDQRETQDDLADKFCKYYRHHEDRTAYLWFDHSGNLSTGVTKGTRAELFKKRLESHGWRVQLMTRGGRNVEHERKHVLWNMLLKEDNGRMPVFRINLSNARELWVSMSNAQATQSTDDAVQKDKRSERSRAKDASREYSTDLSDAIDTVVYGMFSHFLNDYGAALPETRFDR